jgi:hypothetical protein
MIEKAVLTAVCLRGATAVVSLSLNMLRATCAQSYASPVTLINFGLAMGLVYFSIAFTARTLHLIQRL